MKTFRRRYCLVLGLLIAIGQPRTACAQAEHYDPLHSRSNKAIVVEMAQIIKQYAYFNGITMVHTYDAWADTTEGIKLYIGTQVSVLGDPAEPEWYYIDFAQPITPTELKITIGRNDNFIVEASKKITKRAERRKLSGRTQREKQKGVLIFFLTDKDKRTTDFGQLHNRFAAIVNQLTRR